MRKLEELINTEEQGWTIVKEWIDLAKNTVEILPRKLSDAEEALVETQVTTRSLMGAIIYETGGLIVDHGWIRILGASSERMKRSLPNWNKGRTFSQKGDVPPYLLIADDVLGGLYALNGGYLGQDAGNIYYFSPQTLAWEAMGIGYSQFLLFCFENDMDTFYEGLRWSGWQNDLKLLHPDYAYSFVPFLWTQQAQDINKIARKAVPIAEVYNLNMEMKETLR